MEVSGQPQPVTQDIGDLVLGQVFLLALQFYQEPG